MKNIISFTKGLSEGFKLDENSGLLERVPPLPNLLLWEVCVAVSQVQFVWHKGLWKKLAITDTWQWEHAVPTLTSVHLHLVYRVTRHVTCSDWLLLQTDALVLDRLDRGAVVRCAARGWYPLWRRGSPIKLANRSSVSLVVYLLARLENATSTYCSFWAIQGPLFLQSLLSKMSIAY